MNAAQKQYKKLNKKMVKSYFGNLLRNFFRRKSNATSKMLTRLAKWVSRKERNPQFVLQNYDKIAGAYVNTYNSAYENPKEILVLHNDTPTMMSENQFFDGKTQYLVDEVFSLPGVSSVVEIGAGEAITLAPAIKKSAREYSCVAALDLSWSRMAFAKQFCQSLDVKVDHFVVGDAYHLPFCDNAFDLVYTYHCLEQMPFSKEQSLSELHRIARKYVVLIEPSYELGNTPQRLRWRNKNYVRGLPKTIKKLGFNLKKHERIPYTDYPNSAAIHIIEKNTSAAQPQNIFICPETKKELTLTKEHFFCKENGLVYPVLDSIALLEKKNAIVASKYADMS